MTFERILEELSFDTLTLREAKEAILSKDKMRTINYFVNRDKISKDTMKDNELMQLRAIVGILQILYNSKIGSPIRDMDYDTLQEMLVDMGIPRLSGSIEINDMKKESHKYTNLRGTLNKFYYLFPNDRRTNPSRKYLDEWIKSMETKYEKTTGKKINLNDQKVLLQPKFDGASVTLEIGDKMVWLTRGDTGTNRATDVSHILNIFNDLYREYSNSGIKFEVMVTEDNKDRINSLFRNQQYKNSRQVVTATLNSKEPDFKAEYLYPIPLRMIRETDELEQVHPKLMEEFPTKICKLSERDDIKAFANENRWVLKNGMRFRTDGIVLTILNLDVQRALSRENNINNWEIAYKFASETARTKVRDIEFYISEFGWITPVLVVNDVILKGNTINRISLSNKERFDELFLAIGDEIIIEYDIIPYAYRDEKCARVKHGRKIPFVTHCPKCREELDLDVIQVQCHNKECPSRIIGKILNYCSNLRIQNIGYQTLETLWTVGLLKKGIRSLYKLKKKTHEIEELDGFGKLKTRKIVAEIESKRRIRDYEFFGSIGIESLSMKTFKSIFSQIKYQDFVNMMNMKNFELMMNKLLTIDGMAEKKSEVLVNYLRDSNNREEIQKLIEELSIHETYGESEAAKGKIVFSGFRDEDLKIYLESKGYEVSDSLTRKTAYLIVKKKGDGTSKELKATEFGIPILEVEEVMSNIGKSL